MLALAIVGALAELRKLGGEKPGGILFKSNQSKNA